MNSEIFSFWGNIWTRLVRNNIYIKGLLLLNDIILNIYKNVWDDVWCNTIVNKASYSFLVIDRVGYVYLQDGNGEGSPKSDSDVQKDKKIREFLSFLYFDYNMLPKEDNKKSIIKTLEKYNLETEPLQLSFLKTKFYVLDDLLNLLIQDPYVENDDKVFLNKLLQQLNQKRKS